MKYIKSIFKMVTCIARENIVFSCNNNNNNNELFLRFDKLRAYVELAYYVFHDRVTLFFANNF